MKTVLLTFNSKYIHSSLALASLVTYAGQQGFAVQTFEFSLQTPILKALSDVYATKPDTIGIAVHIWNRQLCFALARMLKKVLPETVVVLGGPEVSFDLEQSFVELPEVDFIVQGEGEESFCALLEQIKAGKAGRGIKGIAWLGNDNRVESEGGVQTVADLSKLSFPYTTPAIALADRIAYYESTRGCPFSCAYCLSGVSRNVRYKPLKQVFADLSQFIKLGVKQVKFVDRTYNLDKKHYLPIMKWLAEQKTKTNFHFEIKADNLDDEVLAFLSTVPKGLFQFEIGIQSTYEKTLQASGRKQDWSKLCQAVEKIKGFGNVHLHLDLIAGLPYETLAKFAISFNNVYALKPEMLQLGFLKLLKGSLLEKKAQEYDYIFMPEPPYEVLSNKFISYSELRKLKMFEDVLEQTYNSGKFVYTLKYIVESVWGNDAFSFYNKLAVWWDKKGLFELGHNAKAVAQQLVSFCEEHMSGQDYWNVLDCLKYDIILFHEKSFRPDWLSWQTTGLGTLSEKFWRNDKLVEEYVTDFKFKSWRDINASYHVEIFEHYYLGQEVKEQLAVLFDLNRKEQQKIKKKDFFV